MTLIVLSQTHKNRDCSLKSYLNDKPHCYLNRRFKKSLCKRNEWFPFTQTSQSNPEQLE